LNLSKIFFVKHTNNNTTNKDQRRQKKNIAHIRRPTSNE